MLEDPTDYISAGYRIRCFIDLEDFEEAEQLCSCLPVDVKEPLMDEIRKAKMEGTEKHMVFHFYLKRYKKSTSLRLSSGGFSKFWMIFDTVYMLNLIIFLPSALQFFLDLLQI